MAGSSYLQAKIPNQQERINVLRDEARFFRKVRDGECKQKFCSCPIRSLLLCRKILNDMGSDEVLESAVAHLQDNYPIIALTSFHFPDCLFPHLFISAAYS